MPSAYSIELAASALASLRAVRDKKIRGEIAEVIDRLARRRGSGGKPLVGPLEGLRSVHAARDRYRIIYQVAQPQRRVLVLFVGRRRPGSPEDVYRSAARLLRRLLT